MAAHFRIRRLANWAFLIAILLSGVAILYLVLWRFFGMLMAAAAGFWGFLLYFGVMALALTPVWAAVLAAQLRNPGPKDNLHKTARLGAVVMLPAALIWGYIFWQAVVNAGGVVPVENSTTLFVGGPALLSLALVILFTLIALRLPQDGSA